MREISYWARSQPRTFTWPQDIGEASSSIRHGGLPCLLSPCSLLVNPSPHPHTILRLEFSPRKAMLDITGQLRKDTSNISKVITIIDLPMCERCGKYVLKLEAIKNITVLMILNVFCELSYLFQGYFTWLVFPIHIQIIVYSLVHFNCLSILILSF